MAGRELGCWEPWPRVKAPQKPHEVGTQSAEGLQSQAVRQYSPLRHDYQLTPVGGLDVRKNLS